MSKRTLPAPLRVFAPCFAGALAAGALLLAGCTAGVNDHLEETVAFESTPGNATVKIDGAEIGRTPMKAVLSKMRPTHIVIAKPGFKAEDVYVRPQGGELSPNPVSVALRADLLPETHGADPRGEYNRGLDVLKQYVAMGRIAPEDQAYVEQQLRTFYGIPAPGQ